MKPITKYFRTEQGELVNIVEHTLNLLQEYPNMQIYIGTDSQVYGGLIRYVTAIVYRYSTRGAHYIFSVENVPRIKDDFLRLYNEGARTIETNTLIQTCIPSAVAMLEFDYAGVKRTLSSKVVNAFKGMPNSRFKGGEMIATKAADYICRNIGVIMDKWKQEVREEYKEELYLVVA